MSPGYRNPYTGEPQDEPRTFSWRNRGRAYLRRRPEDARMPPLPAPPPASPAPPASPLPGARPSAGLGRLIRTLAAALRRAVGR